MSPLVRCSAPTQLGARPPSLPYIDSALTSCTSAKTSAAEVSHTFIANIDGNGAWNSARPVGVWVLP